jgi:hypothetical protein
MNYEELKQLFLNQLEIAAQNAEDRFKLSIPRKFKIRLFPRGTVQGHKLFDIDSALKTLYLDGHLFPLYVDMAIEAVTINRKFAIVYLNVSSHERVPFDLTWNYKSGSGPFKQQINEELSIIPDYI